MRNEIKIYYDEDGDLLEVIIGKPLSSYYTELSDGIFERRDKKTDRISGFSIFSFRKRTKDKKGINVPLPINIQSL